MPQKSKSESEASWKLGQTVMAQWPGGKLWYRGKLIKNKPHYEVEFEDGSKHKTLAQGIQSLKDYNERLKSTQPDEKSKSGKNKSPKRSGRPQSRSRSRSAGRQPNKTRSRSRTPAKSKSSKSPGQSPKSPERSSRSTSRQRTTKKAEEKRTAKGTPERKSPGNKVAVLENSKQDNPSTSGTKRTSSETVNTNNKDGLRNRTPKVVEISQSRSTTSRTSARIAALQTARVAGIVTPELSFESRDLLKKEVNKIYKTGKDSKRHFGGAFGAFFFTIATPLLILALNMMCTKRSCTVTKLPVIPKNVTHYVTLEGTAVYLGWVLLQALLYAIPIGRVVEGQVLLDGTRLKYRVNGIWALILSLAAVGGVLYYFKPPPLLLEKHYFPMLITSLAFSLLLSITLFIKARWAPFYALSPHGNSGNFIYDFFMGRELNPRLFGLFDVKMFLELRPGLIGWAAINVCLLYKDFKETSWISYPLLLSVICQLVYIVDALYMEEGILSTWDITTEGLGFMLTFGNLCFVPFFFTVLSRFLQHYHPDYHWAFLVVFTLLNLCGYFIFRTSNNQKDKFRKNRYDPTVSHLKTISTGRPKEILAGGWWGWLRHPNYLGDLMMAASWCLFSGFTNLIPYAYFIYLFLLLVHRAIRDDASCRQKYGSAWDEYCSRVRHRIIPKVF